MKKITFYTSPFIQNKVFDLDDPIANINNFAYPHWKLKDSFFKNGYDLSTQDINSTLSHLKLSFIMICLSLCLKQMI